MEMSRRISSNEEDEEIYVNMVSSGTRENKSRPASKSYGCYKWAVVCLGLLCVLLVVIITRLWLKTAADSDQTQTMYSNWTRESELLQSQYNNLTREKSLLQDRFNAMAAENDALKKFCKGKMEITQHAVDVTLDPDTAHNYLLLSADGKEVRLVDIHQNRPDNPKRFDPVVSVLGKQSFSSGKFYYEVQVSGKTDWSIGVARGSINRKGRINLSPGNGYWTIWLRNGDEYQALAGPDVPLSLKEKPERVGVYVDYTAGLVSFYDADRWIQLYSYRGVSFSEIIYPYFSPSTNDGGKNSSPLIITPVCCPN